MSFHPNAGGPPRSVGGLCSQLAKGAYSDVHLLFRENPGDPRAPISEAVQLHAFTGGRKEFIKCTQGLVHHNLNILHGHGVWLPINHTSVTFARNCGLPYVLSPRGMLEPWAMRHKLVKKKIAWYTYVKRSLDTVTAFHATSDEEAAHIRKLGFKQPIAVIPNGVELPKAAGMENRMREKGSKRTALFLSRINPKKGLPMLLDVWARLRPPNWRLVIAGNDDSNHLLMVKMKIRELGLEPSVDVVGPVFGKDKEELFRSSDLFILPSYSENFGIVVTEALGYGLPVLTTTGCPWRELEAEKCGWWVEPTPAEIQKGLAQALSTSPQDLREMGERGRKLVEDKYLWPGIAERMLELYEWILHGGTQPDFVI